jgi:hypothetical protein
MLRWFQWEVIFDPGPSADQLTIERLPGENDFDWTAYDLTTDVAFPIAEEEIANYRPKLVVHDIFETSV